jgi:hypothetical protein
MTVGTFAAAICATCAAAPGERRVKHHGPEAFEFLRLQRLPRQIALRHRDAARQTSVVGCGALA